MMDKSAESKKKSKKKPSSDRPKRPLSAYNLFFQSERERILRNAPERPGGRPRRSHGKIGFAPLARAIADRWNSIEGWERRFYDEKAALDKIRYSRELEEWNRARANDKGGNSSKTDEDDKKPPPKSSGRIKVVPPPIAPRIPTSPPEAAVVPRNVSGFVGNTPQVDGSVFPPLDVWQPIEPSTTMARQQGVPNARIMFGGKPEGLTERNQPETLYEPRQLHPENRANRDSSLAGLANNLDEESIDFISNLFQGRKDAPRRRGSF
jgi:hypothetical protein